MKRIINTLSQKWPEYLLEILVITIGILGAFALNNWNENRKTRKQEIELLTNLRSDFETRVDEIKTIQEVRSNILQVIDTLYLRIENKEYENRDSELDSLLSYLYISYRFNNEFSSLDMLFSSGGIVNLSNSDLKETLIKWPWLVAEMLEEQDRIENQMSLTTEVLSEYVLANNLYKNWAFSKIHGNLSSDYFPSNYKGLFTDRRFLDVLAHRKANLAFNVRDGKAIIELGNKIIKTIEQEISNQ
ncbi:DUF6090 family protein [Ekhidna sp.]|uniref:DUF6090 family protein n=1 Tax=Ekhidna sp. TaxID=2608089 RepID=UPI0032EDDF82